MTRNNIKNNAENNTESIGSYESSISDGNPSSLEGPPTEIRKYTSHSRRNGWSWPLHPRQVISWIVLLFITSYYFCTIATALWKYYIYLGYSIPAVVALIHIIAQFGCVSMNPADPNVRGRDLTAPLPAFDRSKHAHVIENLYCNICETSVTDDAKHCSYCNKCIEAFDHHCFWLNNCIGGRNYKIFIVCLVSAILFCILAAAVTIVEIVFYFVKIQLLYSDWPKGNNQSITLSTPLPTLEDNESLSTGESGKTNAHLFIYTAPCSQEVWIAIAFFYLVLNVLAIGLIGHLLGFHIYLMSRNLSTYSYIMLMREREIAAREKENGKAKDTPSCSTKSRSRVGPNEAETAERQKEPEESNKPTLSEEEKRNFGMELRNGVGEKQLTQNQAALSRRKVSIDSGSGGGDPSQRESDAGKKGQSTTSEDGRGTRGADNPEKRSTPSLVGASPAEGKTREKRKKKTRGRYRTVPSAENLARVIKNYEVEIGVSGPPVDNQQQPDVGFENQRLPQRRRSAGADSGVVISPHILPPLVSAPAASKEDTDITFGSPLTEIPIQDLKSFYRSEIQYVNFS